MPVYWHAIARAFALNGVVLGLVSAALDWVETRRIRLALGRARSGRAGAAAADWDAWSTTLRRRKSTARLVASLSALAAAAIEIASQW